MGRQQQLIDITSWRGAENIDGAATSAAPLTFGDGVPRATILAKIQFDRSPGASARHRRLPSIWTRPISPALSRSLKAPKMEPKGALMLSGYGVAMRHTFSTDVL